MGRSNSAVRKAVNTSSLINRGYRSDRSWIQPRKSPAELRPREHMRRDDLDASPRQERVADAQQSITVGRLIRLCLDQPRAASTAALLFIWAPQAYTSDATVLARVSASAKKSTSTIAS